MTQFSFETFGVPGVLAYQAFGRFGRSRHEFHPDALRAEPWHWGRGRGIIWTNWRCRSSRLLGYSDRCTGRNALLGDFVPKMEGEIASRASSLMLAEAR